MATRAQAEKFLDELASNAYALRTKYAIEQEDLFLDVRVRIDEHVRLPEAFKNVSRQ